MTQKTEKVQDRILKEIREEMISDWLWNKYSNEMYNTAIKEVEKELGFWKSVFGKRTRDKIKERQWKLFEELKEKIMKGELE